jgi:hypothetical protein
VHSGQSSANVDVGVRLSEAAGHRAETHHISARPAVGSFREKYNIYYPTSPGHSQRWRPRLEFPQTH